jgi:hypothetical protein
VIKSLIRIVFSLVIIFTFSAKDVSAQTDYKIKSFKSTIELQQNTDLLVTEEIQADFYIPKHGIFRIIPVTYSARGRTINADFDLLGVTDENGRKIDVGQSKFGRSVKLKIGDPEKTFTGEQVYFIEYKLSDIVSEFDAYDEV